MKRVIVLATICLMSLHMVGQMVMSAEGITPDNVCKPNTVYFLMEKRAHPTEPVDSIEAKLNQAVRFAIDHPSFKAKPAIQFAVNCKGEIGGGFHVVTKSGNIELDNALVEFFKTIASWQPGYVKKNPVDSWYMWRLEIKDGYIDIL